MVAFDGRDVKVLLVEDNEHFRRLTKTILHAVNIRDIAEAADGAEALERLSTFEADLCVVDWRMEGMDGLEFTRAIRLSASSPNPYMPLIMCTAYTEAALVLKARDAGVTEFLAKPISARSLLSRILAVSRHPRPFIRAESYFGPDRRRRQIDFAGAERRDSNAVV